MTTKLSSELAARYPHIAEIVSAACSPITCSLTNKPCIQPFLTVTSRSTEGGNEIIDFSPVLQGASCRTCRSTANLP